MAELPPPFTPHLVILGSNATGRYFGSAFSEPEAEAAERAAGYMDLHVLRVVGDELLAHAADFPRGKLFPSGKAFVPLASKDRVAKVMALGEAAGTLTKPPKPAGADAGGIAAGGAADGQGQASPLRTPKSHDEIVVGDLVLCSENGDDGYWPAIVVELAPSDDPSTDVVGLIFRDFDGYEKQVRLRAELGLMPQIER